MFQEELLLNRIILCSLYDRPFQRQRREKNALHLLIGADCVEINKSYKLCSIEFMNQIMLE